MKDYLVQSYPQDTHARDCSTWANKVVVKRILYFIEPIY